MALEIRCERCNAMVPQAVFDDTGGICRDCQKNIPNPVTVADLVRCLRGKDKRYLGITFDRFRKRKPPLDAIPVLREALGWMILIRCGALRLHLPS